jgi:hypothetical protein
VPLDSDIEPSEGDGARSRSRGGPAPAGECDGDGLVGAAAEGVLRQRRFLGGFDGEPVPGLVGDQPVT